MSVAPDNSGKNGVSSDVVCSHCTANRAIYINAVDSRNYARHIAFCSATALDFGLHGCGQKALIDEISGYFI